MKWTAMRKKKPEKSGIYVVCKLGSRRHDLLYWPPRDGYLKEIWGYVTHWILLPPDPKEER